MSNYGHEWANDASDLNNLNSALGSNKKDKNARDKEQRFIDHFYPFGHTARIEHLFVMESNSKEPLHSNLVTAGERAEYVEFGVRYGMKEALWVALVFLIMLIMQIVATLKFPSTSTETISKAPVVASIITLMYGAAYSLHIAKYNVGPLTAKVINALLVGRLMIVMGIMFGIGWGLSIVEDYVYANTSIILTIADDVVPDKAGGFSDLVGTAFSYIMMPFGGGFPVTERSVAYMMTVVIPELFSTWREIGIVALIAVFVPIIATAVFRQVNVSRDNKALNEFENY